MADPVLGNGVRAQVIFQGQSGLPRDRFVNSWAFEGTGASISDTELATVRTRLVEFYTSPVGAGTPLTGFMSRAVKQAVLIRLYRLSQTPPRTPIETQHTFNISQTGTALPNEVAVVLSFYNTVNVKRRRGRIFFGPLAAMAGVFDTDDVKVEASLRTALSGAANRLAAYGNDPTLGPHWSILSQRDAQLKLVTDGWIDNTFDTQRRRGVRSNLRTSWV